MRSGQVLHPYSIVADMFIADFKVPIGYFCKIFSLLFVV